MTRGWGGGVRRKRRDECRGVEGTPMRGGVRGGHDLSPHFFRSEEWLTADDAFDGSKAVELSEGTCSSVSVCTASCRVFEGVQCLQILALCYLISEAKAYESQPTSASITSALEEHSQRISSRLYDDERSSARYTIPRPSACRLLLEIALISLKGEGVA